jgi:hypothetical protein
MFPNSLATGPFSLRQDEDCCALSIGMEVDEEGALQQAVIQPSSIRVAHRLSYDETDALLSEPGSHPLGPDLALLHEVRNLSAELGWVLWVVLFNYPDLRSWNSCNPLPCLLLSGPCVLCVCVCVGVWVCVCPRACMCIRVCLPLLDRGCRLVDEWACQLQRSVSFWLWREGGGEAKKIAHRRRSSQCIVARSGHTCGLHKL